MTQKHITIISNPAAGQRSKPFLDAAVNALEKRGEAVEMLFTEYPGHAVTLARTCADSGLSKVIVASGGDGTIREVAEGLLGLSVPIGIIPAGTANVLARELGYMQGGFKSAERVADILCSGAQSNFFPFRMLQAGEERMGLCWVGAGFDGEVLKHIKPKWKARFGRAAFVVAIFKAILREPKLPSVPWSYRLTPDSAASQGHCGWGLVANIRRYAGPFCLTEKTRADDKALAALLFEKSGCFARMVDQLLIAFTPLDSRAGSWPFREGVLTLGSEETPIQLDGDLIGTGPVEVAPGNVALTFQVPSK